MDYSKLLLRRLRGSRPGVLAPGTAV